MLFYQSAFVGLLDKLKYSSLTLTNNPTRCTILCKYIYLYLFSTCFGHPCAHHQEKNYCIYATLVFVTLNGWRLVCWLY